MSAYTDAQAELAEALKEEKEAKNIALAAKKNAAIKKAIVAAKCAKIEYLTRRDVRLEEWRLKHEGRPAPVWLDGMLNRVSDEDVIMGIYEGKIFIESFGFLGQRAFEIRRGHEITRPIGARINTEETIKRWRAYCESKQPKE